MDFTLTNTLNMTIPGSSSDKSESKVRIQIILRPVTPGTKNPYVVHLDTTNTVTDTEPVRTQHDLVSGTMESCLLAFHDVCNRLQKELMATFIQCALSGLVAEAVIRAAMDAAGGTKH